MQLTNKKVWITGASSGIGESIAYTFAKEGSHLILSGRNTKELERVKQNCTAAAKVDILALDLSKHDEIFALTKTLIEKIGPIDFLINNAGISQRSLASETAFEVDQFIVNVNLLGTIALTKAVLPSMIEKQAGQIVVVTSLTGKFGSRLRSTYAATKHGLHGFFDSLRAELHNDNIKILIVAPGFVQTNVSINAVTADGSKQGTMDAATKNGVLPALVAKKLLHALKRNKEEIYVGKIEVLAVYLKRFFPRLFSRILRKAKVT